MDHYWQPRIGIWPISIECRGTGNGNLLGLAHSIGPTLLSDSLPLLPDFIAIYIG